VVCPYQVLLILNIWLKPNVLSFLHVIYIPFPSVIKGLNKNQNYLPYWQDCVNPNHLFSKQSKKHALVNGQSESYS